MQRFIRSSILSATVALWFPSPALAITYFANCEQVCSGTCELNGNVSCNTKMGITLTNGGDLDLKGYSITCTADCPQSAITMSGGSGNKVENTGGAGAGISGKFTYNVNCGNRPNSQVSDLKIENTRSSGGQGHGVFGCKTVTNNVFIGHFTDGYGNGTAVLGNQNGGVIADNYITNWGAGMYIGGSEDTTIERNVIVIPEGAQQLFNVFGIDLVGDGGDTIVAGNTFIGGGATTTSEDYTFVITADGNTTATFKNNFCDPLYTCCQNCTDCANSSGPPTAPLVY